MWFLNCDVGKYLVFLEKNDGFKFIHFENYSKIVLFLMVKLNMVKLVNSFHFKEIRNFSSYSI